MEKHGKVMEKSGKMVNEIYTSKLVVSHPLKRSQVIYNWYTISMADSQIFTKWRNKKGFAGLLV